MAEAIVATYWQAQLTDGSKMQGGRPTDLYPTDVNVSAVQVDQIKVFSILHNDFTDTYFAPTKTWYHNGIAKTNYTYPTMYRLLDGSTLTVDQDASTGYLKLTQI